jgi:exosortase family protein XrtF
MKAALRSNAFLRFILTAGILYLLFYFVYQFVVRRFTYYDQAFIGWIIESSDFFLKSLGYNTFKVLQNRDVQVLGIDGSNGVWIGSNCNAISLFGLFSVFILAYPGNNRAKVWFIPAGIVAIHLLNVVRVSALAIIAYYDYTWLDFNHTYTFNFLVYTFIFFLWILWVNRFSTRTPAHEKV